MINIKKELEKRNIPDVLTFNDGSKVLDADGWKQRREEIKRILLDNIWGRQPDWNERVSGEVISREVIGDNGDIKEVIKLNVETDLGSYTFPFELFLPAVTKCAPVFVHISFVDLDGNEFDASRLICSEGYAYARFFYRDVITDIGIEKNMGIGELSEISESATWGKVHMWAWGAMRIMDYLEQTGKADVKKSAVIGHSRLGKAAVCAGSLDERFGLTISNCSGGAGIALFRGKQGELIKNFSSGSSKSWFCDKFPQYSGLENELPFDLHYAVSMMAPRYFYAGSAKEDQWSDPISEFLSVCASDEVYRMLGEKGLVVPEELEFDTAIFDQGNPGYHLREGIHLLSEEDWKKYISYRRKHNC